MNPLQRTLIEKAGHDNGFEHVLAVADDAVTLASARHHACALVSVSTAEGFLVQFQPASPSLLPELLRSFGAWTKDQSVFDTTSLADLTVLLRRAAKLSQALPHQAEEDYQTAVTQALTLLPPESKNTEIERLVRQRVGQDRYRNALLDYWGGACAVTGVTVTETLRASHAKPWAECDDDAERLDVFNGFLLVANLDALFDRFLISFDKVGKMLLSTQLLPADQEKLGIFRGMSLRWQTNAHQAYLDWHRQRFLNPLPQANFKKSIISLPFNE